jgi:hypothetical protein
MTRLAISVAIVIVFVVAAEHFVGWQSLVYPWFYMDDPARLAFAVALLGATYVIRAFRVYRYFHFRSGFARCLRLLVTHTLLVNLLPMRAGEFAFPVLMSRYFAIPIRRSLPALLWLRALDLHVLLCIRIALVAATQAAPVSGIALVVGTVWLALPFAAYPLSQPLMRFAARKDTKPYELLQSAVSAIPETLVRLVEDWLLTMVNWIIKLAVFSWIILAFSGENYVASLAGAIGGEVGSMLPVQGIAGIGTYEAGVVAGMRSLGVTTSNALTGAVNLHLLVLGVSILGVSILAALPAGCQGTASRSPEAPPLGQMRGRSRDAWWR